jgi:hypothetical protein
MSLALAIFDRCTAMTNHDISHASNDVLFSTTPVVKKSVPPVIVVGLPRSGSTYMAHVLSCLEDFYVFDDLYPYQIAKSFNLSGPLNDEQKAAFVDRLSWAARVKIKWNKRIYAFAPNCDWDDVAQFEEAVLETFRGQPVTWMQLLEEWMTRLTLFQGKKRWGYKTPQDFQNMHQLSEIFPGCQFFYIVRNPHKVMNSLKNLPSVKEKVLGRDGCAEQYHPIAYAIYWKMAYEAVTSFKASHPNVDVFTIKFEDLISQPDDEAQKIANLLQTTVTRSVKVERNNSSFDNRQPVPLTSTEKWLCEKIAGGYMQELGYELQATNPSLADLPDLIKTTTKFTRYQTRRITKEGKARHSVASYIKQVFKLS